MDANHNKTDQFYKMCDSMKEYMSYLSNDQKLFFYALFKQGTVGNAPEKPAFSDPVTVAKWEAWNKRRYMNSMEAKQIYVNTAVAFLNHVESSMEE
jgi:acyl-CoA-binding protein